MQFTRGKKQCIADLCSCYEPEADPHLSCHELSKSFRKCYRGNDEDDDSWIHETAVDRNHLR